MKKVILPSLAFLCFSLSVLSQPAGYVRGTQVCWTFNGHPHGYFRAVGNGERHILISFTGIGEKTCGALDKNAPQKWFEDAGVNWDGRTVNALGDTIAWEVFTLLHDNDSGFDARVYARDIEYFFQHMDTTGIDTSMHCRFHIQGLSAGARNIWFYLTNNNSHNSPYRKIFSTSITMSTPQIDNYMKPRITAASVGMRHWVWHGLNDGGCCPSRHSDTLYKYLSGNKLLTQQPGGGHDSVTWDSAMSISDLDAFNNRWVWMAQESCGTQPPNPGDPYPGGPPGYIPGTQVCWTINGRPHGYFRAAGNGEKHTLISFTTQNENSCANYANNAPQKWLPGTWNGKTVRAPGDTIIWEIFTIVNTNNNFLKAYADDIDTFFNHITADTSDHSKFHVEAKGPGGINRMWGYLVNAQTHNSPYRHIFSTTISQSTPHLGSSGLLPLINDNSAGRKHWVWYGTADGTAPPAASQQLYDSLQGIKTLTAQVGGTTGAGTWDSCLSRSGTTVNTNRWLWMISGSSSARAAELVTDVPVNNKLGIYPNPARNQVMVSLGENLNGYRLIITDVMGRQQKVINNIRQPNYVVDISSLQQGVYFIQIESGNKRLQKKLIKE
jgi:hypothetical protein